MIIADGVPILACIKTDIAFQSPDFFLQGVDLLVDGFQLGSIGDGGLLFLQFLDGLLGFGEFLLGFLDLFVVCYVSTITIISVVPFSSTIDRWQRHATFSRKSKSNDSFWRCNG